jgi:hypothetical protein
MGRGRIVNIKVDFDRLGSAFRGVRLSVGNENNVTAQREIFQREIVGLKLRGIENCHLIALRPPRAGRGSDGDGLGRRRGKGNGDGLSGGRRRGCYKARRIRGAGRYGKIGEGEAEQAP